MYLFFLLFQLSFFFFTLFFYYVYIFVRCLKYTSKYMFPIVPDFFRFFFLFFSPFRLFGGSFTIRTSRYEVRTR